MSVDTRGQEFRDFVERVRSHDRWALTPVEAHRLAGQLKNFGGKPDVRIAFAGNVVLDPLAENLLVQLAGDAILADSYSVPFGQLVQELLEPDSGLRRFDPDFLHLHFEVEQLLHGAIDRREFETAGHRRAVLAEVVDLLAPTINAVLKNSSSIVLLNNFVVPGSFSLGLADFRTEYGEAEFFAELNSALPRLFRGNPRVQIVDVCTLTAQHGRRRARDARLYYTSKIPWSDSFFAPLADRLSRHVKVTLGRVRKCLVVDLDNTLWHGVLGEEGPLGVRIGIGDPAGEAHLALQRNILALKRRGILLAACSKNNPEDVAEIFRLRPDMPLRRDDFACMEVGWDPKHEGLRRIAGNLGIGTDSLVFLDDNPAEIALIEKMLPEVECVLAPADANLLATCLDSLHSLDRALITAEDLVKDRQYKDADARKASREEFADLRDYLHSLHTSIIVSSAGDELLPRAHQLFTKTNQFNSTGRRYTLPELERFSRDSQYHLLLVHACDRFGDLGWVGAAVLRAVDDSAFHIENWVLSCRVLGRGIEVSLLNHIERLVFDQLGCFTLTADFRATKKNAQVAAFFEAQGFETKGESEGVRRYALARGTSRPSSCDWITVAIADAARERAAAAAQPAA